MVRVNIARWGFNDVLLGVPSHLCLKFGTESLRFGLVRCNIFKMFEKRASIQEVFNFKRSIYRRYY